MNIRSQKGEATFETIIAMGIAVILLFIVPLMTLASQKDKNDQALIQAESNEFISKLAEFGFVTSDEYDAFNATINSTGTLYDIELEFKILDENASKKQALGQAVVLGENTYYSQYTSTIMEELEKNDVYVLKEGDIVKVSIKNASKTFADTLRQVWANITGNDAPTITADAVQTVKKNGR